MNIIYDLKLSNDTKFKHVTAFKVAFVPFISLIIISFGFWIFLETMYGFFLSSMINTLNLKEMFYKQILSDLKNYIPLLLLYFVFLYVIGFYLANLLLRSFKKIGKFAAQLTDEPNAEFKLSTLEKREYLMRFAQLFFDYIAESRGAGVVLKSEIPMKFWNIKGVVFDYLHYLIYVLLLFVITIVTTLGLDYMSKDVYQKITNFAVEVLQIKQNHMLFFSTQQELLSSIVMVTMVTMVLVYFIIANNLFAKTNGVTYAYFRTLKDMIHGNWEERINLRYGDPGADDAKFVNQLIDFVEEEIDELVELEEIIAADKDEGDAVDFSDMAESPETGLQEEDVIHHDGLAVLELESPPPLPPIPNKK